MKPLLLTLLIPIAATLSSCSESIATSSHDDDEMPVAESGAKFKDGQGISLTEVMTESIGLKTAEVTEDANARVNVPRTALLSTVEGHFVYARNGDFYLRTPVKTGTQSSERIEIVDGLYAGDEVVTAAVMSLWLAELQYLRGGKACACAD